MKKEYITPAMQTVMLQHQHQLLSGSPLTSTSSNLDGEDDLEIIGVSQGIWGR